MARPQVTVNIAGALPGASIPTDTGTLFFVFAGTGGPTSPTEVATVDEAVAAGVPTATAAWIGDALVQGVNKVVVLRADAVDAAAVTQAEWTAALDKLTPSYGPGQVTIPGVATDGAHQALLAHVDADPQRVAFLDVAENATADAIATSAAALAASAGATRAGVFGPWVSFPGAGAPRTTPASVVAAGLAARGDAAIGHANQSPIFDQGRGAGTVAGALDTVVDFTDADADMLYDAGVNLIRLRNGIVSLTGWRSVTADAESVWRQLNIGRLTMQLSAASSALMYQFLGSQIDGSGILFSQIEGIITGYLQGIYAAQGLFGATADDAFQVVCDFSNNTPATIAAGQVNVAVAVTATTSAEQIVINVVTSLAG